MDESDREHKENLNNCIPVEQAAFGHVVAGAEHQEGHE
jgi:hypothetical protein